MWSGVPPSAFPASLDFAAIKSSTFYVTAYTLEAGTTYNIKLTVRNTKDPSRTIEVPYQFSVGSRPLVAAIAGGSESKTPVFRPFTVDAALSMDPDEPSGQQATGLAYTWTCTLLNTLTNQQTPCLTVGGTALALAKTAEVTVPASTLPVTTTSPYAFTVSVSKAGKTAVTATKLINISPDPIPLVSLEAHSSLRRKDGKVYINEVDNLIFRGTCESSLAGTSVTMNYKWTIQDLAGKMVDMADTSVFTLGSEALNLVMLGGSGLLTPGLSVS